MKDQEQEEFLHETSYFTILDRGTKKVIVELTSVKTLFLAFLCVAMAYHWIGDMAGVVGGIIILGVKEIPSDLASALVSRFVGGK